MNFAQMFINSIYVLGIILVCTLIYCVIAGVMQQAKQRKFHRRAYKELSDSIIRDITDKIKEDINN